MHHQGPYLVGEVMSRPAVAVLQKAGFREIVEAMTRWQVSAVPVLDRERTVVGVVSEADLLPKEEFRNSDPSWRERQARLDDLAKAGASTAEQIMTSPAVTVRARMNLAQAARIMAVNEVKRLPVVDADGRLEGVVSRRDLLKVFLRTDAELADEVREEIGSLLSPGLFPGELWVRVTQGVVTLSGRIRDTSLVPVVSRVVRAVEGVVDVEWALDARDARPQVRPLGADD
ncbi:CBS domain-containing protein [Streptomyces sp. NBC_01381]|uniref:CBS domain-containing protein n=1 Tax=Streptomyces sp. NBC_01381 TaxID=2903845 RepID=UPI002254AA57|nr:CBS domain-containing protein [Streptomyces sp. NBC_01381]MCX4673707.1 CBS domain-containing protein [Streptomyces sp. NBC_01381]